MGLRGIPWRIKPRGADIPPDTGLGKPAPGSWVEGAVLPAGALCSTGPVIWVWREKGFQLILGRPWVFLTPRSQVKQLPEGSPHPMKPGHRSAPGRVRSEHMMPTTH